MSSRSVRARLADLERALRPEPVLEIVYPQWLREMMDRAKDRALAKERAHEAGLAGEASGPDLEGDVRD